MKLLTTLTTLIMMTVSTIAFADVSVNEANKTDFIYVSKKVHDELDAQYKGMIHSVNSNLYSKSLDEQSVKYESIKVVYENVNCDRESIEENQWCEVKRNELVNTLTADVMKSDLYQMAVKSDARNSLYSIKSSASDTFDNLMYVLFSIAILAFIAKLFYSVKEHNSNNPDKEISFFAVIMYLSTQTIGYIIGCVLLVAGWYLFFHTNIVLSFMRDYPSVCLFLIAITVGIGYLISKELKKSE